MLAADAPRAARRAYHASFAVLPLLLSGVVYYPITRNYFHMDDFLNLQWIANDSVARYVLQPFGGHILFTRNLLFYLFYQAFGPRPEYFFWAVLLTHLANVVLLFGVIRLLTASPHLGCLGASLWGTAPVNEGALGWYSVYGHVIVGTILLYLLYRIAHRMQEPAPVSLPEALLWCALLLTASASFGVGIGIALAFPAVAFLLLPGERMPRPIRFLLLALPPVLVAGYVTTNYLYTAAYGGSAERGMMRLLGMLADWRPAGGMFLHLLAVGVTALGGNLGVSLDTYPSPLAYTIAGAYLVFFLAVLVLSPPATRRLLVALAVIALSTYAIIAAGRAAPFAASAVRAYGAYADRYHYVGSIPLAIILCVALGRLGAALRLGARSADGLLLVCIGFTAFLYGRSGWTIDHHAADRQAAEQVVGSIRSSIGRAAPGEVVYIVNQAFPPAVLQEPFFAGWAAVYTIFFPGDLDRRVRFVDKYPRLGDVAHPGSRLAAILVPPEAADGSPAGDARAPRPVSP